MKPEQFPNRKEGSMGRPAKVARAIYRGDSAAIQSFAAAGGKAVAEKRARERVENEMLDMARAEEALARQEQANEHIVPLDSDP